MTRREVGEGIVMRGMAVAPSLDCLRDDAAVAGVAGPRGRAMGALSSDATSMGAFTGEAAALRAT